MLVFIVYSLLQGHLSLCFFLLFALFSLLTNETGSVIMRVDYLYFQSTVLEKTRLFNTDQMRIFDPHNI